VESNLNEVLKEVTKIDNTCKYGRCKEKTSLMGVNCEFCSERFCFKHSLPEIHGCSEKVKKKERDDFLHPKVDTRSMKAKEEHDKSKKKLDIKLKQMEVERRQKPSGSGSKNKGKK
jgi:predicted nucleic acid binding AN1-type Zn finger protein